MFNSCYDFNQPLENWDVSGTKDFNSMFQNCFKFNQPLGKWALAAKTKKDWDISGMFYGAKSFDQDISSWNLSKLGEDEAYNVFEKCKIRDEFKPKGDF